MYFFVLSSPIAPVTRSVPVLIVKDNILCTVLKLMSDASPNIYLIIVPSCSWCCVLVSKLLVSSVICSSQTHRVTSVFI